jgi:hypothetical protein
VIAESGGTRFEGRTGTDGRYSIDAPPGAYDLVFDVPYGLWADVRPGQAVLRDPRECATVDAMIRSDGRIAARIVDSRSAPVSGLLLLAVPWSSVAGGYSTARTVTTADGTFEFTRLPPGNYFIRTIALIGSAQPGDPPPHYLHLGASAVGAASLQLERSLATRITLDVGRRLVLPDFVLPLPVVTVDGVVRDPAGRPAKGVTVHLFETHAGRIVGTARVTGEDGRFRIAAAPGSSYQLGVESSRARSAVFDLLTNLADVELRLPEPR